jgi:hypothetical protein
MAKGHTVTHKLAVRVHHVLIASGVKNCEIDPPQFSYYPRHRNYEPSSHEIIDVDESTLPRIDLTGGIVH